MSTECQGLPIKMLPELVKKINSMLEESLGRLENMRLAVEKPQVMDGNARVSVVCRSSMELGILGDVEQQISLWTKSSLTETQRIGVERLTNQALRLKSTNEEILRLHRTLEPTMIEKILAMEESELIDKVLSGEIKPIFKQ